MGFYRRFDVRPLFLQSETARSQGVMLPDVAEKTLYLIRHGESTFNQWRKKSILTCSWICVRDPLIYDAKLSARGHEQVVRMHEQMTQDGLLQKIEMVSALHHICD